MRRWMLAAVVALAVAVAGCGTDETGAKSKDEKAPVVKKGPVKGQLTISQWPLYIDPGKKGTIAEFEKATEDQWLKAVDKIKKASDSGQVRKFTGNDYIKDLPKGDTWIALGWSGDAIQLQKDNPHIKFVMPKEGCMLWSTSMEIPVGAPNPQAAQKFIDFVYDPKVQADVAEWVNYVTPVRGVQQILRKRDPALAKSELIFPSEAYTANCSFEPVLGGKLGQDVTEAFQQAIGN